MRRDPHPCSVIRLFRKPQGVVKGFSLRDAAGAAAQTYALGVKEVWRVAPEKHVPGSVWHTVGYPLPADTYGGSFVYHMHDNMVSLGYAGQPAYPAKKS